MTTSQSTAVLKRHCGCDLAAYRSGANDSDAFLISHLNYLPCLSFRDALSYDGNSVDLKTQLDKRGDIHVWLNLACLCSDVRGFYVKIILQYYLWVLHGLHGAVEGRAQGSKADQDVHLGVLLHGVGHVLVDRQQDLFVAPVELLLVIPTGKCKRSRT